MPAVVNLQSKRVELEEDAAAVYEAFYERGWTDGLPIIPPTPRRIEEMLHGAGRDPAEVLQDFLIAVAGGLGGYHSTWLPTWGNTRAITRKVRVPGG